MLTLDDIRNLPNDPTPEHLIAAGLLPAPAPATPAIPAVGPGTIPKPSPVHTLPPEAQRADWHNALAAGVPTPRAPLPPLSPVTAPDLGTGVPEAAPPTTPGSINTPIIPQLPHLGFKERQALPLTSEGVAPGSKEESLAKLERMEDQKANPWGSPENHPGLLGKIGHIAAKVGNIAGNIVAPATMANIPGTELNKQEQEAGLKREIGQREERELAQKKETSEEGLRSAEAEEAQARAKKLGGGESPDIVQDSAGNAVGWRDEKGALHSLDEEGTPASIKSIAEKWEGKAEAKPQKENLEQGLAGAVQDAIDNGRDPKEDSAVQGWAQAIKDYKPSKDSDVKTAEDLKHRIVVAMESGDVAEAKRLQAELNSTDPEGMARLADAQARMAATAAERAERQEERQEKQGLKWVTGETADGKTVTVPYSQAQAMGLKNQAEATNDHVGKVLASRVVVPMLFNTDPNDLGVIQIVNELDKKGELGPLASRWNDFLARKWGGSGDPLFAALLTRLDLAQTKMMQAHVGNRGGSWMLEHFEDLANARKLDAPTLRATLDQELRYMSRSAERPPSESVPKGGEKAGHSFTVNGQRYQNVPDDVYQRAKLKPGFKE